MTIEYTLRARTDLAQLYRWHREHVGRDQAIEIVARIEQRIGVLAEQPELGPVHWRQDSAVRRIPLHPYNVIYQIQPERVVILRILHHRIDVN